MPRKPLRADEPQPPPLPDNTWKSGWPQKLNADVDQEGELVKADFWRLRDGVPHGDSGGEDVLYGLILRYTDETPVVSGKHQYTPDYRSISEPRVEMLASAWASNEVLPTDMENTFEVEYEHED